MLNEITEKKCHIVNLKMRKSVCQNYQQLKQINEKIIEQCVIRLHFKLSITNYILMFR